MLFAYKQLSAGPTIQVYSYIMGCLFSICYILMPVLQKSCLYRTLYVLSNNPIFCTRLGISSVLASIFRSVLEGTEQSYPAYYSRYDLTNVVSVVIFSSNGRHILVKWSSNGRQMVVKWSSNGRQIRINLNTESIILIAP
jgi:branched-subunit amino acid ABC-type transport system permease component